jgi:hypothetical protein
VLADEPQPSEIESIITELTEPISKWVGFNRSAVAVARECGLDPLESDLLNFHRELAEAGEDFSRQHIDVIRNTLRQNPELKKFFQCVVDNRNTTN